MSYVQLLYYLSLKVLFESSNKTADYPTAKWKVSQTAKDSLYDEINTVQLLKRLRARIKPEVLFLGNPN